MVSFHKCEVQREACCPVRAHLAAGLVLFVALSWHLPGQTILPPPSDAYAKASESARDGRYHDAELALRVLVQQQPASTEAHFLLGYVLFREREPVESLAEYTAGARLRPPTSEELTVVASDYILLKDYTDAERWLLLATQHKPEDPVAWYLLGRSQYNEDHEADALESFKRCISLRPRDIRAEYNAGLAYEKLGRLEDAERAYTTAIEWQEGALVQDPQPYLNLGMLLLSRQASQRALEALRQAVDAGKNNALANQELGLALEALGRHQDALVSLKRATELAPNAVPPHFFLGRVYRRLGKQDDAKAEFAAAARLARSRSDTATPNNDPLSP